MCFKVCFFKVYSVVAFFKGQGKLIVQDSRQRNKLTEQKSPDRDGN